MTFAHFSTSYWLFATVFLAKFQCQACEWSVSLTLRCHFYFSLSGPVIRSLGRYFPTYILCPSLFLPKLPKPNTFVPTRFGSENFLFHVPWTKQGMLAGKTLMGEKSIHAFVLEVWGSGSIQHTGIAVLTKDPLSPRLEQTCWVGTLEGMAEIA